MVLGLLWCNVGFADDLNGKKILCERQNGAISFEFTYFSKVKVIYINASAPEYLDKKFTVNKYKYETTFNKIIIKYKKHDWSIGRENLTFYTYRGYKCELVDKNFDLEKKMKKIYEKAVKELTSENKI